MDDNSSTSGALTTSPVPRSRPDYFSDDDFVENYNNGRYSESSIPGILATGTVVTIEDFAKTLGVNPDDLGLKSATGMISVTAEVTAAISNGQIDQQDVAQVIGSLGSLAPGGIGLGIEAGGSLVAASLDDNGLTVAEVTEYGTVLSYTLAGAAISGFAFGGTIGGLLGGLNYHGYLAQQEMLANDQTGVTAFGFNLGRGMVHPIVMDLDGDGIEFSYGSNSGIDFDDDGYVETGSWVSSDDGLLVVDLNADGSFGVGDGEINQALEYAFSLWSEEGMTDLQALAEARDANGNLIFDSNGDGVLNSSDALWSSFRIWQDLDQNGIVGDNELRTLNEWNITSIGLSYNDGSGFGDASEDIIFGNVLHGVGDYTITNDDGTIEVVEGGVGDVSLSYNELGWRRIETAMGYAIEFENGDRFDYAVLDASDASPNIDLDILQLDGATGDERHNNLTASGATASVAISGGAGNDVLTGGAGDDMLSGDEGTDILTGGEGDDLIFFDAQDSIISGGDGYDIAIAATEDAVSLDVVATGFEAAYGHDGDDHFTGATAQGNIAIYGGAGNDSLTGGGADDVLTGDDGNDTIDGGSGDDFLSGGAGSDQLTAGTGDDFILGGDGVDYVWGGLGDDFIMTGNGGDHVDAGSGDDYIDGDAGNDAISGGLGDDTIYGGDGNDTLYDGDGDDSVSGGEGDDVFYATSSTNYDVFQGGLGNDTIYLEGSASDWTWVNSYRVTADIIRYETRDSGVTVPIYGPSRNEGIGQFSLSNGQDFIEIQDIEQITFLGDGSTTTLTGVDATVDNSDTFYRSFSGTGAASGTAYTPFMGDAAYIAGLGSADDVITSSYTYMGGRDFSYLRTANLLQSGETFNADAGNDNLQTGAGNDIIYGGSGSDTLYGEAGNDTLFGQGGSDYLQGNDGNDSIDGGNGSDLIYGFTGDDTLSGGSGNDVLSGGTGHDHIDGGDGSDQMGGEDGNDTLFGGHGNDVLFGGLGNDTLDGGISADRLYGNEDTDTLYGQAGNDLLSGGAGNDVIYAGIGSDLVLGDEGNDVLSGAEGDDALYGGVGSDTISGGTGADYIEGGAGTDTLNGNASILDIIGYSESDAGVSVNLSTNAVSGGHATGDVISGFEGAIGSDHNDTITGSAANNALSGLAGDDTLSGLAGHDTLAGGDGNDSLIGGTGTDDLFGGAGNDTLDAGSSSAGRQYLEGGTGDDTYVISGSGDHIISELGDPEDIAVGDERSGNDTLRFTNIALADVSFTQVDDSLLITWDQGSVSINDGAEHIERFEFADGEILERVAPTSVSGQQTPVNLTQTLGNAVSASSSSVHAGHTANYSIDGITGGSNNTHTSGGANEWIEVDLAGEYFINDVSIVSRSDYHITFLNGAVIHGNRLKISAFTFDCGF